MNIAAVFRAIELTQSRNAKQEIFLKMLHDISGWTEKVKQDTMPVLTNYLDEALKDYVRVSIGLFAPRYDESFEVNIAEQLTTQALAKTFNTDVSEIKTSVRKVGDFGDVAVSLKQRLPTYQGKELTLSSIVEQMKEINALEGNESQALKIDKLCAIFKQTKTDDELRYLVRSFSNTGLRIGLSSKSVEKCILDFFEDESKKNEAESEAIQRRIEDFETQIFGYRIQKLHTSPHWAIYNVPIKSMLGRAASSAPECLKLLRLNKQTDLCKLSAEFKYDGERSQLHYHRQALKMFSRNFELQNSKHWQVEDALKRQLKGKNKSFIVDGEIVYVDPAGKFLPFQAIERKLQTEQSMVQEDKIPRVFLFDILALDQRSLCHLALSERRKYLTDLVQEIGDALPQVVQMARTFQLDSSSVEAQIDAIQALSLQSGCEGIIVKSDCSPYETGGIRSNAWTKFKGGNLGSSLRDTIDLVPIGGYYGKGVRTGVFGSYLMAAYNPQSRKFETVCKLGTGFGKEQLQSLHEHVKPLSEDINLSQNMATEIYSCHSSLKPDVWLNPTEVWEVQADSFTLSKSHTAGKAALKQREETQEYAGLSMRFPRFIRVRDDKAIRITQADYLNQIRSEDTEVGTSVDEILRMYFGT